MIGLLAVSLLSGLFCVLRAGGEHVANAFSICVQLFDFGYHLLMALITRARGVVFPPN